MKSNVKQFASNASWIMVGRIFQLGLTFYTTMIVTRHLGPTEYGKMNYVYSYIQMFLPLCQMGMNGIVVKELVDDRDRNGETLGTMSVIRIIASLISMILSVLVVMAFNSDPIYKTIAILQSFALLFQSFDGLMYYYQSKMLSKKTGAVYAISYILTAIFRIVCVKLNKDVKWFAFAISLDFIIVSILLLSIYLKDKNILSFSIKEAKRLLSKSYHYILAGILVVLYGKVNDTLLLGKLVNDTAVGYYSSATVLCNAWPFVLTAIIDSASPTIIDLYKTNKDDFYKRIKQLYAAIFYIGIIAAIAITFLAKFIISILYGEAYYPAIVPLQIACWNTAFSYLGVARSIWLQCEDKNKYEVIISLFGAIVNILLNILLINKYGIIGAAIALTLTQLLTNYIFLYFVKGLRENAKLISNAIMLKDVFK